MRQQTLKWFVMTCLLVMTQSAALADEPADPTDEPVSPVREAAAPADPPVAKAKKIDHSRSAGYFGFGLAHYWPEFGRGNFDSTLGFNARGGYRFLPYLAAEVDVDYANEFWNRSFINGFLTKRKIRTVATTVNLKLTLPLGWLRPYLLGGIGFQYSQLRVATFGGSKDTATNYNFVGRAAGGFDIMLHEHLGFHVEGFGIFPNGAKTFNVTNAGELKGGYLESAGINTGFRYVF